MTKSSKGGGKKKPGFLSLQELALLMGLSRQTIRNWIDKGDIRADQTGRKFNIPVNEAIRILERFGLPVPDWLKDWNIRR